MLSEAAPLGNRTTSIYNSVSQVIATIDPLGNWTSFSYVNGPGARVEVTNFFGAESFLGRWHFVGHWPVTSAERGVLRRRCFTGPAVL